MRESSRADIILRMLGAALLGASINACSPTDPGPGAGQTLPAPDESGESPPIAPLIRQCQADQRFRVGQCSAKAGPRRAWSTTALVSDLPLDPGPLPPDLSQQQVVHTPIDTLGVVNDAPPFGLSFGAVAKDTAPSYRRPSDRVEVSFWSAHPRSVSELARQGTLSQFSQGSPFSYFEVQRLTPSGWTTVTTDAAPDARFIWQRIGLAISPESQVTVSWDLDNAAPGNYRILHRGVAKQSMLGLFARYVPFSGTSRVFRVD